MDLGKEVITKHLCNKHQHKNKLVMQNNVKLILNSRDFGTLVTIYTQQGKQENLNRNHLVSNVLPDLKSHH